MYPVPSTPSNFQRLLTSLGPGDVTGNLTAVAGGSGLSVNRRPLPNRSPFYSFTDPRFRLEYAASRRLQLITSRFLAIANIQPAMRDDGMVPSLPLERFEACQLLAFLRIRLE